MIEQRKDKELLSIKFMTALRGVACLMVVLVHLVQVFTPYGMYLSGCGKIGVWFFLVSSGFLTMYPYEREKNKFFSLKAYYKNKIIKLYPVYLFVLILSYMVGYFDSQKQLILHLFFGEGKGHFWYMPVIMKMYLIMPVFICMRKKIKSDYMYMGILLLLAVLDCCMFPYWKYEENSIHLYWYFPLFIFGFLLAHIYNQLENKQSDKLFGDFVVAGSMFVLLMITPFMRKIIWNVEPSSVLQNKYLYIGILWCFIILGCRISRYVKRLLEGSKSLLFLGDVSYALYLLHYVIFMTINNLMFSPGIKMITGVIVTFVLSVLIHLIEKYYRHLRDCEKSKIDL